MTRVELATKIRQNLNDAGITYYSNDDVNDSIQDHYDEVAVYCECIERKIKIDFQDNLTYYNLRQLVPDYYRPIWVFNNLTNRFVDPINDRINSSYRLDWETVQGTAYDYSILGPDYLGFSGRSTNATGNFTLYYKALAPVLTDSSTILVSSQFLLLLENGPTADLLEQNQEYIKAQTYWSQYDSMIEKYREKIQLLAKTDRVFTRF